MKKNSLLLKVTLPLVLALLILVSTFLLMLRMTEHKMESSIEKSVKVSSEYANRVLYLLTKSNEWLVYSFMSGFTNLQSDADTNQHYHLVFSDEQLHSLTREDLMEPLCSFVTYNSDFYSSILIFEPHVLHQLPQGIAIKVSSITSSEEDLLTEGYHVFENPFYQLVKQHNTIVQDINTVSNDSTNVVTYGVPLYNEMGNMIGEFWVDIEASRYSKLMMMNHTQDEVGIYLIDEKGRIVSSMDSRDNGKMLWAIAQDTGDYRSEKWCSEVRKGLTSDSIYFFITSNEGKEYITYLRSIEDTPLIFVVVRSGEVIYHEVVDFIGKISFIMFAGMLLTTLCLFYIFRTMKRKHEEDNIMKSELNVATSIQRGILPKNIRSTESLDIYGFQHSAKSVGGDLYDFVRKDNLLHFCIGDVSGKGMPAALVMTELCSLYRYIINYHSDPCEIVTLINKAVMERSDDSMFCTLFVGVLNLKTGQLCFCNAGHNPPIYINKKKQVVDFMKIKPNMPVYAFSDYLYQEESLQLNMGDRLYLYTDGVTEAMNESNQFYGNKAMLATISRYQHLQLDQMVDGILHDLKSFTRKAEQNDDITMLCIEYKGYPLHYDNIKGRVVEIVNDILALCNMGDDMRLRLAIEEVVQNISDYAYPSDGPMDVEIVEDKDCIEITIKDNGQPFNPLNHQAPNLNVPISEREIGGLGISLMLQIVDDISYQYNNNQNILKIKYITK